MHQSWARPHGLSAFTLYATGFASWLRFPLGKHTFQAIETHCPRIDDSYKGQLAVHRIMSTSKVVLCTLNTAGSSFLRKSVGNKFTTMFLDEAAQVGQILFDVWCFGSSSFADKFNHSDSLFSAPNQNSTLQQHFLESGGLY